MARVAVTLEMEFPDGVELCEYRRIDGGHGFHVRYPPPSDFGCDHCGHREPAAAQPKNTFYTVRDLDVWQQPAFFVYQPLVHRCSRCGHRQHLPPPFKRKDASYTFRFEQEVVRRLRGSTAEEVAKELVIDAETVERIVAAQVADARAQEVAPDRVITDVGIDEISLKKGHKLYATLLWDLTDAQRPHLLAAAEGRDEAAVRVCLEKLTERQRRQVTTLRSDMGAAMLTATKLLPQAQSVIDRFHVAQRLGEVADGLRKNSPTATSGG